MSTNRLFTTIGGTATSIASITYNESDDDSSSSSSSVLSLSFDDVNALPLQECNSDDDSEYSNSDGSSHCEALILRTPTAPMQPQPQPQPQYDNVTTHHGEHTNTCNAAMIPDPEVQEQVNAHADNNDIDDNGNLQATCTLLKLKVGHLTAQNRALTNNAVNAQQSQSSHTCKCNRELALEIEELQRKLHDATLENQAQKSEVHRLTGLLAQRSILNSDAARRLQDLTVTSLRTEEHLVERAAGAEATMKETKKRLEALEEKCSVEAHKLFGVTMERDGLKDEVKGVQGNLEQCRSELQAVTRERDDLRRKCDSTMAKSRDSMPGQDFAIELNRLREEIEIGKNDACRRIAAAEKLDVERREEIARAHQSEKTVNQQLNRLQGAFSKLVNDLAELDDAEMLGSIGANRIIPNAIGEDMFQHFLAHQSDSVSETPTLLNKYSSPVHMGVHGAATQTDQTIIASKGVQISEELSNSPGSTNERHGSRGLSIRESLLASNTRLEEMIRSSDEKMAQLRAENTVLQRTCESLSIEVEQLRTGGLHSNTAGDLIANLQGTVTRISQENAVLLETKQSFENENLQLVENAINLERQLEVTKGERKKLIEQISQVRESLAIERENLTDKIENLTTENESLNELIREADNHVSDVEEEKWTLLQKRDESEKQNKDMLYKVERLERQMELMETARAEEAKKLEMSDERVSLLNAELVKAKANIESELVRESDLHSRADTLSVQLEQQQTEMERLSHELDCKQNEIASILEQKTDLEKQYRSLQKQVDRLNEWIDRLEEEKKESEILFSSKFSTNEHQLASALTKAKESAARHEKLSDEVDRLQSENKCLQGDVDRVTSLKLEASSLSQQKNELEHRCEVLENELKESKSTVKVNSSGRAFDISTDCEVKSETADLVIELSQLKKKFTSVLSEKETASNCLMELKDRFLKQEDTITRLTEEITSQIKEKDDMNILEVDRFCELKNITASFNSNVSLLTEEIVSLKDRLNSQAEKLSLVTAELTTSIEERKILSDRNEHLVGKVGEFVTEKQNILIEQTRQIGAWEKEKAALYLKNEEIDSLCENHAKENDRLIGVMECLKAEKIAIEKEGQELSSDEDRLDLMEKMKKEAENQLNTLKDEYRRLLNEKLMLQKLVQESSKQMGSEESISAEAKNDLEITRRNSIGSEFVPHDLYMQEKMRRIKLSTDKAALIAAHEVDRGQLIAHHEAMLDLLFRKMKR